MSSQPEQAPPGDSSSSSFRPILLTQRKIAPTVALAEKSQLQFHSSSLGSDPQRKRLSRMSRLNRRASAPEEILAVKVRVQDELFEHQQASETLSKRFEEFYNSKSTSLILITGPCGSGKSTLAASLKNQVEEVGGYYLSGKFDQLQHPVPYMAFVSAFSGLVSAVTDRGTDAVMELRRSVEGALGFETSLLTKLFPMLAKILGQTESSIAGSDDQLQMRFLFVFLNFIRAIAKVCPVVLHLDDLHWADESSVDLLIRLVNDSEMSGLCIVGTFDFSQGTNSCIGTKLQEAERKSELPIHRIPLSNMEATFVCEVLGRILKLDVDDVRPLVSNIILPSTLGNAMDIVDFVEWMQEAGVLFIDESEARWAWDEEEVELTLDNRRPCDIFNAKMTTLPKNVKELLKVAACLGCTVDTTLLKLILGDAAAQLLQNASYRGLLTRNDWDSDYTFSHDRVQSASYDMIPLEERPGFHLEIGRRLWQNLSEESMDKYVFLLVAQFQKGQSLFADEKEKEMVTRLCLHAATKAARSSSFRVSLICLEIGLGLLGTRGWKYVYELTLSVHNAAIEVALCTANHSRMNELIEDVLVHARTSLDKITAYSTRLYALGNDDRPREAVDTALDILEEFGETFPRNNAAALLQTILGLHSIRRKLRNRSDESILRSPVMQNHDKLAAMRIMNSISLCALLCLPHFWPLIVIRQMMLSLEYGMSAFASPAFGAFGMVCSGAALKLTRKNVEEAYRYGLLSLALLRRFNRLEFLPRVFGIFYAGLSPLMKPSKSDLPNLLHGYQVGLQTGDLEAACFCGNMYFINSIEDGESLPVIQKHWKEIQDTMDFYGQQNLLALALPCMQSVHNYLGLSKDPVGKDGDVINFDRALKAAIKQGQKVSEIAILGSRMILAFVFNSHNVAEEMMFAAYRQMWLFPPSYTKAKILFFVGMVSLDGAKRGRRVVSNILRAKKITSQLKHLAELSPFNFLDKSLLLRAELASFQRRNAKAFKLYLLALAMAEHSGFPHFESIICERTARHLYAIGDASAAKQYFEKAIEVYRRWAQLPKWTDCR